MSYGFKVITGVGSVVVYDADTPAPGYILEQFDVTINAVVTRDYSLSGCTELLPYAFCYIDPANVKLRGYPKVTITGLSITVNNTHPSAAYGWGGVVRVIVLGR